MVDFSEGGNCVSEIEEKNEEKNEEIDIQQDKKNLDFIYDIPLQLTVELGRTKLFVKDVLQLNQGAVVELGKRRGNCLMFL